MLTREGTARVICGGSLLLAGLLALIEPLWIVFAMLSGVWLATADWLGRRRYLFMSFDQIRSAIRARQPQLVRAMDRISTMFGVLALLFGIMALVWGNPTMQWSW